MKAEIQNVIILSHLCSVGQCSESSEEILNFPFTCWLDQSSFTVKTRQHENQAFYRIYT